MSPFPKALRVAESWRMPISDVWKVDPLLPFAKARQLAEAWVNIMLNGRAEIVRDGVEAKPYGWIFYYQSSAALRDPSDTGKRLLGNAPFIIDRINGGLHVLGTGPHLRERLMIFEQSVPDAVLSFAPEPPTW
jgi:hypothetical protein